MMDDLRDCIRCGQLVLDDIVDNYESTMCESCADKQERKELKLMNREYERGLLP